MNGGKKFMGKDTKKAPSKKSPPAKTPQKKKK